MVSYKIAHFIMWISSYRLAYERMIAYAEVTLVDKQFFLSMLMFDATKTQQLNVKFSK